MEIDNNYKRKYDEKWNFKDGSMKDLVHGLHPYPAMMMPLIARTMFNEYGKGENTVFLDPYVGSGTTLVEAQYYGAKKAFGIDLNPLAVLISRTKTEVINLEMVKAKIDEFDSYLAGNPVAVAPEFSIRNSWFSEKMINELAIIRNFFFNMEDNTVNDFFKTSFSEVVRSVSETRNGEFKLYRMSKKSLEKFNPDAIGMFREVIKRNFEILKSISYKRSTEIEIFNDNTMNIPKYDELVGGVDLIITSPPYGDSHTTVAYGQFSRLSNEWLGFAEAGSLDRRLLGGARVKDRVFDIQELDEAIEEIKERDKKFTRERWWEVTAFYNDYEESIKSVAITVKKGGHVVYVVGNRRVRNVELPMDVITYKMFEKLGFEHVVTHVRDILNKRMPSKASPSNEEGEGISTMMNEYIVVMKKK